MNEFPNVVISIWPVLNGDSYFIISAPLTFGIIHDEDMQEDGEDAEEEKDKLEKFDEEIWSESISW